MRGLDDSGFIYIKMSPLSGRTTWVPRCVLPMFLLVAWKSGQTYVPWVESTARLSPSRGRVLEEDTLLEHHHGSGWQPGHDHAILYHQDQPGGFPRNHDDFRKCSLANPLDRGKLFVSGEVLVMNERTRILEG